MASSVQNRHSKTHVLEFFHDDEDGCALTVMRNGIRFHIIADGKDFTGEQPQLDSEYRKLLHALRKSDGTEQDANNGEKGDDSKTANSNRSGTDSAIDMTSLMDAQEEMQNWMLAPMTEHLDELAPAADDKSERSVHEWYYDTPTHFFELRPDENCKLAAIGLEQTKELKERVDDLVPRLDLPKYIRQLDIPRFNAADLTVATESDMPEPFHPTIVESQSGEKYFFKLADTNYPGPTKREIKLLKEIEKKGLLDQINAPQVHGLLYPTEGSKQPMGFLMTVIKNAKPLTQFLDEDVSQRKRDKWAKEVDRIKELLHENDIVFGDMKADNFLVDGEERLWIIDFGGMYTEGWVDPHLNETEEGDDMGAEKIVNALRDPVANTVDAGEMEKEKGKENEGKKRKADDEEEDNAEVEEEAASPKRRKVDEKKEEEDEERYCICHGPDDGKMIACDNEDCKMQWFHFECVGIKQPPAKEEKWFCEDCVAEKRETSS